MARRWPQTEWQFSKGFCAALIGLVWLSLLTAGPASAQGISLIRDAETEEYLREQTDPILRAAGLVPNAVDLYLVNDTSMNAFVTGGQNIFVHTGMILASETPNDLLGVMAHEAGHIAGGHIIRGREAFGRAGSTAIAGMVLGVLAAAAGAPDAGLALITGSQHVATRQALSYNRSQEAAADQAALRYLNATGMSGEGLVNIFGQFRDRDVLTGFRQDPYIRTHPLSRDRLGALEQGVKNSPYYGVKDSPESMERWTRIKAKLEGFVQRPDVTFREYPDSDTSIPAHYARAYAYYRLPDAEGALKEVNALLALEPENPFFHELKGQVLFETGRPAEAVAAYEKAVQYKPEQPLFRIALAQSMLASDEAGQDPQITKAAKEHLTEALRQEKSAPFAWHQLAIAHARDGEQALANLATAERFYQSGRKQQALVFAVRARQQLEVGSSEYNQALDIIVASQDPERPFDLPDDPRTEDRDRSGLFLDFRGQAVRGNLR